MNGLSLTVRGAAALVAALTVGAGAWGIGGWWESTQAPRSGAFAQSSPASAPTRAVERDAPGRRSADLASLPVPDRGRAPTRVAVPGADIDLPVVPTAVDEEGAMAIPSGSRVAAWYRFGPGAGAESGAAVVAAHVSSRTDGRGPFARLAALEPGARVELSTEDGVVAYEVVSVEQVAKLSLDTATLFDRTGEHRLHLVTCGGRYDAARNSYEDNVVVVARVVR